MKVVCLYADWYNAYGEKSVALELGAELTVVGEKYVAGSKFFVFDEHPSDYLFLATGFRPQNRKLH